MGEYRNIPDTEPVYEWLAAFSSIVVAGIIFCRAALTRRSDLRLLSCEQRTRQEASHARSAGVSARATPGFSFAKEPVRIRISFPHDAAAPPAHAGQAAGS